MSPFRFLRDLVLALLVAALAVWAVTRWVALPWTVRGDSMEPALRDGDRVLVELWSLRRREPRAGDVVLLRGPEGRNLVKRVTSDRVGSPVPYPPGVLSQLSPLEPRFAVLGDNPDRSGDSREFGLVPRHRIRGRVAWRYWPVSRAGPIE